jgi:hypothetical protein
MIPRMRPSFERFVAASPAVVQRHFRNFVAASGRGYAGQFYPNHIIINVPPSQAHFWSPQLSLDLESRDGGTLIRGLYSPRPSVWTMFMALYAMVGFGGLIGLFFGVSQWSLGMNAYGLWSGPAAAVLGGCVYSLALVGQWLSQDQIAALQSFAEGALRACDPPPVASGDAGF